MFMFIFFCVIGSILGASTSNSTGSVNHAIDDAEKVFTAYENALNKLIPTNILNQKIGQFSSYRNEYSSESGVLVGQIKTSLQNSEDSYFSAMQSLTNWCGESTPLLEGYVELFNDYDRERADAQKGLLLLVLSSGISNTNGVLSAISRIRVRLSDASDKLSMLAQQLTRDCSVESDFFKSKVREAIQGAVVNQTTVEVLARLIGPLIKELISFGILDGKNLPPNLVVPTPAPTSDPNSQVQQIIIKLDEDCKKAQQFYATLSNLVNKGVNDVVRAEDKLIDETKNIEDLRSQTDKADAVVNLDKQVQASMINAVTKFNNRCKNYRLTHGKA